jgi:hypothetical protein
VETTDVRVRSISRDPNFVKELSKILGPDIYLYSFRFVLKDKDNDGAVFLHNDIGYHLGYMNRISAFVAVSDAGPVKDGMEFFLWKHKFGLMGDAVELNSEVLGDGWPVIRPNLLAGDVIIMNSSHWHQSGHNIDKSDRIIADIHY